MSEDNFYQGPPPDDRGHGSLWPDGGHAGDNGSDGRQDTHEPRDASGIAPQQEPPASVTPISPKVTPPVFRSNGLMQLVERYMPSADDHRKVYDAFLFAAEAHGDQMRADKVTPYITHPLEVARFLAELHLDADTICAALLHDVPEDTERTVAEVVEHFGLAVGRMVDGVTKLKRDDSLPTKQAVAIASYQKMMTAMTGDFRVVVVKLADRLHNMKTLGNVAPDKRRRVAEETSRIYVSLARRLGMNKIRRQLQWLCFQNLYPWRSRIMETALDKYLEENEGKHQQVYYSISGALEAAIPGSNVVLWEKNLFRVYEQCRRNKVDFKQQCDLLEISVQVGERAQCYQALGIIHEIFKPRMGMVRDFIAAPRAYGFQSLQTTVTASSGQLVRFQIQTREMFDMAQFGLAAQWSRPETRAYTQAVFDQWSEQIKAFDSQAQNPDEFYADMQADMFQTEIYAYTPEGDVKELPRGATLLDFAYAVHTEIGHHCTGGTVDGRKLSPRSPLPNTMAPIEVLTDGKATPHVSWLNFVKTSRARSNIRSWLRQHDALPERGEVMDGEKMSVGIVVEVRDIKGMLRQITKHLDSLDVNIVDLKISGEGRVKQDAFTLQVDDLEHLQEVIRQLKRIPNVLNVSKLTK